MVTARSRSGVNSFLVSRVPGYPVLRTSGSAHFAGGAPEPYQAFFHLVRPGMSKTQPDEIAIPVARRKVMSGRDADAGQNFHSLI